MQLLYSSSQALLAEKINRKKFWIIPIITIISELSNLYVFLCMYGLRCGILVPPNSLVYEWLILFSPLLVLPLIYRSMTAVCNVNTTVSVQTDKTNQPITSESISWRGRFQWKDSARETLCNSRILMNIIQFPMRSLKKGTNSWDFDAEAVLIKIVENILN